MWKNKIPYINVIPIFIILALIFKAINNLEVFASELSIVLSILTPFFWAFGIAYILNPLMVYFEKKFNIKRCSSILIVFLLLIGFITLTVTIISPAIINNVGKLLNDMPTYVIKTQAWFYTTINKFNLSNNTTLIQFANKALTNITTTLTDSLKSFLNVALSNAIDFTSSFLKMIFGFIISVYILKDKESFQRNAKNFLYCIFKKESINSILAFGNEVNMIFSQYIIGKSIDSLIIGILCAIGLTILKIPYVFLISLLVGITNMIPYFGPFIGMIPAVLITVFYSPIEALWVLIFIVLLQQFDGWVLGPKILGDKVGVSPFWVILAILVGGGTFGVLGMFLGVPIIAVIKTLLQRFITKQLKSKNIKKA